MGQQMIKKLLEGMTMSNPQYEDQLTLQENKINSLLEQIAKIKE